MRSSRFTRGGIFAIAISGALLSTACGGSSDSDTAESVTGSEDAAASEETTESGGGTGAMGDANFAVTTYMDTLWPIEGNPYADAASAESWCATYATDGPTAVAAVAEYLASEPDIAAADPTEVSVAIDEYLTNNCYLLEE